MKLENNGYVTKFEEIASLDSSSKPSFIKLPIIAIEEVGFDINIKFKESLPKATEPKPLSS